MNIQQTEVKPNSKYRYIRSADYYPQLDPGTMKNLCLTIRTDLRKDEDIDNITYCDWSVSFKAPTDQFNKIDARAACDHNFDNDPVKSGCLVLRGYYDHNEIVGKILMSVFINDWALTKHYYMFIRALLNDHEGFRSFFSLD